MKILLLIFLFSVCSLAQDYQAREVKQFYKRIVTNPKVVYVVKAEENKIVAVCPGYPKGVEWIAKNKQNNFEIYSNYTRTHLAQFKLFANTVKGNALLSAAVLGLGC